jgi:excisionase family DNA binding protein
MTLVEIASELRVNPATVRLWVSKGRLQASRAGVRKWIVRRSELERMLAATNPPADVLDDSARRASTASGGPGAVEADEEASPAESQGTTGAQSAIALLQLASDSFDDAIGASRYAPPSPGYLERMRRLVDASEHMASTLLNASNTAGIRWRPRSDSLVDSFPYELQPGGNRPGPAALWKEFDASVERLSIAITGTDMAAVANGFRDLGEALLGVADELERGNDRQVGHEAG